MIILKKYKIFLCVIFFLTVCSQVIEGISLKKKDSSDQFLIQKKDPLILPPNFEKLPDPINNEEVVQKDDTFDIKNILGKTSVKNETDSKSKKKNVSIEEEILKKINKD